MSVANQNMAEPLDLQRLQLLLDMKPFMSYAQNILSKSIDESETENDTEEENAPQRASQYGAICTKDDKRHLYNFSSLQQDRSWLMEVLLSDTESDSEISDQDEYIKEMLKNHVREKKYRIKYHQNPNRSQYGYYSAGVLANHDMFPDHQRSVIGMKKRKKDKKPPVKAIKNKKTSSRIQIKQERDDSNLSELGDVDWEDQIMSLKDELDDDEPGPSKRVKNRKIIAKTPELMAARRKKVWQLMAKKEIGKFQRTKATNHKEMLSNCKKVAAMCQKVARQKALDSQKKMKETIWRTKRLTREMQAYWKRYERVERENKRRMDKEAEEQRKMDGELIEAKRQQRKLNFLITQTELYAHFMSKKLGEGTQEEQARILNQLDEETNPRLALIDDYDSELMKLKAKKNASDAFYTERKRTKEFDKVVQQVPRQQLTVDKDGCVELDTPSMFKGVLKGYQLKGMGWLANLFNQGISGILADEMGLGKTVQSIAFMCHIAENYGVWGPFLIISPASTLHNWQQEFQRFVPEFNVVPYWGSPNERKILRQFWEQKDLHTKDASFHVVITSYQLVVSDYKYFNRIKWQYMVLDEAQAIKSSSSVRWKLLLGFNCRNRLLLSGTPIQNSMAELWALLHFIMPTLFDSHDEFNEWFSKDIESCAENKTGIDERQIGRLHMILKPFMLRRIKKDVENELSDKIEIMVYCPLTTRQKLLYMALKKKIKIEDLLKITGSNDGHSIDKNFTSNLMNLVMQFRKVCNHPELFERRDIKSPFALRIPEFILPRLVNDELMIHKQIPSKRHLLFNKFNIFKAENIHRSLFPDEDYKEIGTFSFARFADLSPCEMESMTIGGLIYFLLHCLLTENHHKLIAYRKEWWNDCNISKKFTILEPTIQNKLNKNLMMHDSVLRNLVFTSRNTNESKIYTHTEHAICAMQESVEHRIIRSKHCMVREIKDELSTSKTLKSPLKVKPPVKSPSAITAAAALQMHNETSLGTTCGIQLQPEFIHVPRKPRMESCQPSEMPKFVYNLPPKVQCPAKRIYCESREAAWEAKRMEQCDNKDGWQLINGGVELVRPWTGWSHVITPDKQSLVSDAGKLSVLDSLLTRLKSQGHRVLIYSQMTKMIDLLEEYMWHRKHRYMRLDGSSKISARRDMVADFQTRADIFVFLLSTRAGGLGINLTAADTVIFYDSDWNPTVDQQAMDRAHRLGQTKQVTVYRLICKGTIEERILQRAREKSEIQRMVISGGNFKPDTLKPKEVVSLLLDDDEIETKYRQKKDEEKKTGDEPSKIDKDKERKRKPAHLNKPTDSKKQKTNDSFLDAEDLAFLDGSGAPSPAISEQSFGRASEVVGALADEDSSNDLVVDCEGPSRSNTPVTNSYDGLKVRRRHPPRGARRGRPRGFKPTTPSSGASTSNKVSPNEPGTSDTSPKRGPGRPPRSKPGTSPMTPSFRGGNVRRKLAGNMVPLGYSQDGTPTMSPAPSPGGLYEYEDDD